MTKSRITIIGLGRIGGSIGLALKQAKLDAEVIGHDKDHGVAGRALKRGAVDKTEWNLINSCDGAGLIVLALPLDAIRMTLDALKSNVASGVIITDTAPTKAPVLEWAKALPSAHFVGGHPVLASHLPVTHGIDNADATIFRGATYCLTPAMSADENAVNTIASFATMLGAKPYFLDAAEHDGLSAGVEHLPALLATALASSTTASAGWRELSKLSGSTFRAATELLPTDASGAQEFLAHRADLARWLGVMIDELKMLRELLDRADSDALKAKLESAIEKREQWLSGKTGADESPALDYTSLTQTTSHFFLGGLAARMPKRK